MKKLKLILKFIICRINVGYCPKSVITGKVTWNHCKDCEKIHE